MSSSDLGEALDALAACFAERQLKWYLFGAQAVVLYGRPRLTADLDVTVNASPEQVTSLVGALRQAGFVWREDLPPGFVERTRVLPLFFARTSYPVDVVLAGSSLETAFLDAARLLPVEGRMVPVICAEDLLAAKILSGRWKDLEDAYGVLLAQRGRLDLERTRNWLKLLEEATDRSNLVRELDRLVERVEGQPSGPLS